MPLNRTIARETPLPAFGYGYGLLFILINSGLAAFFWWQLPPQIPLLYSLPDGASQLADKIWFLLLPALTVAIWIMYLLLSKVKVKSSIYVSILKWLHILCLLLITIAMVHILLITL